jgi:hypothetical protein
MMHAPPGRYAVLTAHRFADGATLEPGDVVDAADRAMLPTPDRRIAGYADAAAARLARQPLIWFFLDSRLRSASVADVRKIGK